MSEDRADEVGPKMYKQSDDVYMKDDITTEETKAKEERNADGMKDNINEENKPKEDFKNVGNSTKARNGVDLHHLEETKHCPNCGTPCQASLLIVHFKECKAPYYSWKNVQEESDKQQ